MKRTKEKWIKIEQVHKIHITRRMLHYLRGSMYQIEDREIKLKRRTRMEVRSLQSVGLVAKIIAGDIFHKIRVVDLRYTVHRR